MLNIKVILGSTRPNRFGIQPAEWITELGKNYADTAVFELVDLKEIDLPLLDIAVPPSMVPSNQNEHQAAWAKIIGEADGFIFVTPEYNHSFPAALKNAIDFLAHEWANKPVAFVSYGADGGVRAVEQLRSVVSWLQMHDMHYFVNFPNYFANLDEQGKFKFDATHEEKAANMLKELLFWAGEMKASRAKLAAK
jgi:NAD(P)H-dependent FMN reductase